MTNRYTKTITNKTITKYYTKQIIKLIHTAIGTLYK